MIPHEIKGGLPSFIYSYQDTVMWHPWFPPLSHDFKKIALWSYSVHV